uniref:Uncharacterized protein n=1 Tax=Glossina pallidipes TaxID=7398 RepID=A0A1A9ZQP5_GLOPL
MNTFADKLVARNIVHFVFIGGFDYCGIELVCIPFVGCEWLHHFKLSRTEEKNDKRVSWLLDSVTELVSSAVSHEERYRKIDFEN